MNIFFDNYLQFIDRIEEQYPAPNDKEFRKRNFESVRWSKPEHQNFFTIIKILAERGACTIDEVVEHDKRTSQFRNKNSRYISYRRLIVGDKNTQVKGLIEKGAVVAAKSNDKLHKKYELSYFGTLYAIKLFMDLEIIVSGNYRGILTMDSKVKWYDYSKQTEFPETIMDILAKNYSHILPMIFGKWEYLKKNPRIDVYRFYEVSAITHRSKNLMSSHMSTNCKHSLLFGSYEGNIALEFYTRQMESAYYPLEHFLKAMDEEIREFIDKIFYAYERLYREEFYRSQSHYFLYKGQKEKALKCTIKAIDANDLLDADKKKEFKENKPESLDYHGIRFCK